MFSCVKIDNHYSLKLQKHTSSYNPELCETFKSKLLDNSEINNLIKNNTKIVKEIMSNLNNTSDLNKCSESNPLLFFSECDTSMCNLNRSTNGKFRNFIEDKLSTNEFIENKESIIYTSYMPGSLLQDIINLSRLNVKSVEINLIGTFETYIKLLDEYNLTEINCNETTYDNEKTRFFQIINFRLIKFMEFFSNKISCINLYNFTDSFVNECEKNKNLMSDITIGIDYVDQFEESIYNFITLALMTTKLDGYIISLRTDGLLSNRYHIEIFQQTSELGYKDVIKSMENYIKITYEDKKKYELRIKSDRETFLNELHDITQDGYIYKYNSTQIMNVGGLFNIYKREGYKEIELYLEKKEYELKKYLLSVWNKCDFSCNIHGGYLMTTMQMWWNNWY